jgi:hypothetical protein
MNVLNNGALGPTADHGPERPSEGRFASLYEGLKAKALPFRSAQRSGVPGFYTPRVVDDPGTLNALGRAARR